MSDACKCDVCSVLYEKAVGDISLNVMVRDSDGADQGWDEIDLCSGCTKKILITLKPALSGFDESLKGKQK